MLDLLIRNAQVIDGSGNKAYRTDVGIKEGRIAAVGNLSEEKGRRELDAAGRCLTPGFIDMHRHADAALFHADFGAAELLQGLTTVINGNCGLSLAPVTGRHADEIVRYLAPITGKIAPEQRFESLREYFDAAQQLDLPLSCGMLAGMGTLRTCAAGMAAGELSALQLRDLHYYMEQSLADGALGVSLGLGYAPEIFYSTDGLIRALSPLYESGVVVSVHMRQEGDGVVDALREMIEVARALKTPVEISHLKAIGKRNWKKAVPEMLRLIEQAREDGIDIACDIYPYSAGSTQLIHVLPPEFQKGGITELLHALQSPTERRLMRERMQTGRDFENITDLVGFENVIAAGLTCAENQRFEGQSIEDIASALKKDPYDALFDLLAQEQCAPAMIDFVADEEDIREILRKPYSAVISDSTYPSAGQKHPRVYGTFARLIEKYVMQEKTLTLEQAVHKVTMHPAERYGLAQKGRICIGADADLLLFAPENVHECGSYGRSEQCAQGMDYVIVGGEMSVAEGRLTGRKNGSMVKTQ